MKKERVMHFFCVTTSFFTFLLLIAGALVTSTGSGLAVPDWPLSYGMVMPPMVGGIFYEHGHRMVASFVGFLTVVQGILLWKLETRSWIKKLGVGAILMVIIQGVLGGITVLFLLPPQVSVSHALLAQTFFSFSIVLSFMTSREWKESQVTERVDSKKVSCLKVLCFSLIGVLYLQLLVGATMRHLGAGLAIPDFPLAFGRLIPPFENMFVVIHFMHRVGALFVCVAILSVFAYLKKHFSKDARLFSVGVFLLMLVFSQVLLGAFTIWSQKHYLIASFHLATGALILGTSVLLTLKVFRHYRLASEPNYKGTLDHATVAS